MLALFLIMCVFSNRNGNILKFLSPQIMFVGCFIPGVIYAFWYVDKWNLHISNMTIVAIILGLLIFVVFSYLTSSIYDYILFNPIYLKKAKFKINSMSDINSKVEGWKVIVLIIMQLISLLLTILFLLKNYGLNLSDAMFMYRSSTASGDDAIPLPGIIKLIRRIALSSGYIVTYLYLNGIVYKSKKNRALEIVCIILAIINGFLLGGRGDGIQIIIAAIVQYMALKVYKNKSIKVIPFKDILKVIVILGCIIASFTQLGELLGRQMDFLKYNDYIAVYLSAELKNLDTFIVSGDFGHPLTESLTLYSIVNSLGSMFNQPAWIHSFDIPFRYYGHYALGNVGTIFYPFVYDSGLVGVVYYTAFMAVFCQIFYKNFLKADKKGNIDLNVIFYSYLAYIILFSFFSNKFYEMIFNTSFLWCIVSWILLKYFLLRIRIKV